MTLFTEEREDLKFGAQDARQRKRPNLQASGGGAVSWLYEMATWLVYALAATMMLAAIAAAILTGLALRFVAEFIRELSDGREEGDSQHAEDGRRVPAWAGGSR